MQSSRLVWGEVVYQTLSMAFTVFPAGKRVVYLLPTIGSMDWDIGVSSRLNENGPFREEEGRCQKG